MATSWPAGRRWGSRRRPCVRGCPWPTRPGVGSRRRAGRAGGGPAASTPSAATPRRRRGRGGSGGGSGQRGAKGQGAEGSPAWAFSGSNPQPASDSGGWRRGGRRLGAPPLLKRRRGDDPLEEDREASVLAVKALDDAIDGLHVIVLETAPQCIGQELLGEAAVEVEAAL